MDSIEHTYQRVDFKNVMKANFRKYFDESYSGKNLVVELSRKLISPDILEIFRAHYFELVGLKRIVIEKILIDRMSKTIKSSMEAHMLRMKIIEFCEYTEVNGNVKYEQKYSVPFFYKMHKKSVFKNGCKVIDNYLDKNNMRNKNI